MRFLGLLTLWPGFVLAQGWIEYVDESGRFSVNLPGEPEVESFVYDSEHDAQFPARLYTAESATSFYSVTVVDFRDAQQIHVELLKHLSDAERTRGSTRWIDDQRASVARAARAFRQRDGEVTYDAWAKVQGIEGHQLQITNPDGSRTFAGMFFHGQEGFLYILEETVPAGAPPPGQFQQSLAFLDEEGARIRYRLQPDGSAARE